MTFTLFVRSRYLQSAADVTQGTKGELVLTSETTEKHLKTTKRHLYEFNTYFLQIYLVIGNENL